MSLWPYHLLLQVLWSNPLLHHGGGSNGLKGQVHLQYQAPVGCHSPAGGSEPKVGVEQRPGLVFSDRSLSHPAFTL